MIELERTKDKKWIFQKNISSPNLIESYLNVINSINVDDKEVILSEVSKNSGYKGRSSQGSLSTMGVRFSQMCFYMFGYKKNKKFIPSQTTLNILDSHEKMSENMLVNLFSIQYPHPYSNTDKSFKIYAGRLITKLLIDERIGCKLYIDEFVYFLPFIKKINSHIYSELIDSIIEFRDLSFEKKETLFKSVRNYDDVFSNCLHEVNYYFSRIFSGFNVFDLIVDKNHNNGKVFSFIHGTGNTLRNDSVVSGKKIPGYLKLKDSLKDIASNMVNKFSPFDLPVSLEDPMIFSVDDWKVELYENDMLKYLQIALPEYSKKSDIIETLTNMTYMSKYSSVDGKDFENSLKPVFELFREVLNVEILSGAGKTDLLCAVEDYYNNDFIYKVNVDAKSRKSANGLNPARLQRHLDSTKSRYCIVVAPKFSRGTILDIQGYPIVTIDAETLALYCSKECMTSKDEMADFSVINHIIENCKGTDISSNIMDVIIDKYGIEA